MYKFKSRYRCNRGNRLNRLNERISPTFWHCIPVSSADTRRRLRSANRHLLAVPRFRLNTQATDVGRSQLLARRPGTHSRILSGIQRAAQTVLRVSLTRTCSRVTSASSALRVLNDYALYKSTQSLTLSFTLHSGYVAVGNEVCRYNWHSAGSLGWPFPMLKSKYIFQIKYTDAILSSST